MNVLGIDVSTFNVDIVTVALDDNRAPTWHRFPLTGSDAWERARSVAQAVPGPSSAFYDDTLAIGVEDPRGYGAGSIYRVQGAVLAQLPVAVLVHPWIPSAWRKRAGLPGNASKGLIKTEAMSGAIRAWGRPTEWDENGPKNMTYPAWIDEWTQDAWDAYCIALATRSAIAHGSPS